MQCEGHKYTITTKGNRMSDLSKYAVKDSSVMQLRDPSTDDLMFADGVDGKPDETKPMTILVGSKASKAYQAAYAKYQDKIMQAVKKGRNSTRDSNTNKADTIALVAAVCSNAQNVNVGDNPLQTPEDFKKLFSDDRFYWVKEQVEEELNNTGSFINK
jgi:hypothetical protein